MIEGDARDEGALIRALDGCDAVVSSLGTGVGFREVSLLTAQLCPAFPAGGRNRQRLELSAANHLWRLDWPRAARR
jgi:hypothetical protein